LGTGIGYKEALMLGIGGMFGLAIFVFPGTTGKLIGSWDIIAWPIAGLLMVSVGLIYSELSSAFKLNGGPVLYPKLVLGDTIISRLLSFLTSIGFFLGWTIAIVIGAITAPEYLSYAIPIGRSISIVLPIVTVIIVAVISMIGIKRSSTTNYLLTVVLLIISLGFSGWAISKGSIANAYPLPKINPTQFLSSIGMIIGAYGAWVAIPTLYKEIRDAEKIVPSATVASIVITAGIYTLLVVSLHMTIPNDDFVSIPTVQMSPFSYGLEKIGAPYFLKASFSLAVFLAIITTMLVGMMSIAASIHSISEQGLLPNKISLYDKKLGGNFAFSTFIAALPSIILSAFPQYFFQLMVIGLVVGTDMPYLINIASYVCYKLKRMDRLAAFRAPYGSILSAIAFGVIGVSSVNLSSYELEWSFISILLISLAFFPVEWLRKKRER
jgi:APA family basic amino acid/polyamine antiporter